MIENFEFSHFTEIKKYIPKKETVMIYLDVCPNLMYSEVGPVDGDWVREDHAGDLVSVSRI